MPSKREIGRAADTAARLSANDLKIALAKQIDFECRVDGDEIRHCQQMGDIMALADAADGKARLAGTPGVEFRRADQYAAQHGRPRLQRP